MTKSLMRRFAMTALLVTGLLGTTAPALAEIDTDGKSPWMFRLRAIAIVPQEDADIEAVGGDIDIQNAYVPELDISYFLDENFSLELILATAPHDMKVKGSALGDVDLGDVWILPPTLLVQYHFDFGDFKPYVGAGVNYTIFYGDEAPSGIDVEYNDTFGWALQIGADFWHHGPWFANVDVKKIFINTDSKVHVSGVGTVKADVDIHPWVFGIGIGLRL